MKLRLNLPFGILLLTVVLAGSNGWAQADPAWLKSWQIAQQQKPQTITSASRIAPEDAPGTPLVVFGLVTAPDGEPEGGVLVHAYHTDADGLELGDREDSIATWKFQGWVLTDETGQFEFQTVRPTPEPSGQSGAHIHFTLESEIYGRQRAPTAFLADDPLVTDDQRSRSRAFGRFGSVREVQSEYGVQHISVNLRLKELPDF